MAEATIIVAAAVDKWWQFMDIINDTDPVIQAHPQCACALVAGTPLRATWFLSFNT